MEARLISGDVGPRLAGATARTHDHVSFSKGCPSSKLGQVILDVRLTWTGRTLIHLMYQLDR
ncbi:hypothetical protein ACVIHH_000083 [Bradyrhizobium sp. USDA 4518]